MSKSEIKYLRYFLKAFQPRTYEKAIQLLRLIEDHPEITQAQLVQKLYGDPNNKSFFHLKNSLEEKMLEVLTLNINLNNNQLIQEDLATFVPIRLTKQFLHAFVLHKRGLHDFAEELLEHCIDEAESWDISELKLLALIQLRNLSYSKEKVCKVYAQDISTTLKQFEVDIMGVGYLDELRVLLPQPASEALIRRLENYTYQLNEQLLGVYSPRGQYYYLILKFILLEAKQAPLSECKKVLAETIRVLEQHKGLRSRNRSGVPYVKMSEIELKSYNFEEAYEASLTAMHILPSDRINHILAGINFIHACLYLGKFEEAFSKIQEMDWYVKQRPHDLHSGWIIYLHSYYYFLIGNFDKALYYFQCITQFEEAKNDWNPALRIYEIQLYIDLQWMEVAESRIEALRKYLARHKVIPRIEQLYQLLYTWEKHTFSKEVFNDMTKQLQHIQAKHPWEPLNYEVFPVEFWLKHRLESKKPLEGLPFSQDYLHNRGI